MEHTSGWLVDQVTRQPELLSVNFADRCQKISDPSCPATDADSKAPGVKSKIPGMTLQKLLNTMKHKVFEGAIQEKPREAKWGCLQQG